MTARRQELTGWVLVRPNGEIDSAPDGAVVCEVYRSRSAAIDFATGCWTTDMTGPRNEAWRRLRRESYSVRRVRVTVEVEEGS